MTAQDASGESKKFPGNWGWIGVACQGNRLVAAHVEGGNERPRVLHIWNANIKNEGGPVELNGARIRKLRETVGPKIARKLPCSIVLENHEYEVVAKDEPELKDVDEAQRRQALRWSLQPMVNFPMDRAVLDVLIPSGSGRRQMMAIVAAEAVITPVMNACREERINLRAIDVPEAAQRNLAHLAESGSRALAMIVLSERHALLTLSADGELLMTRQIEIGNVESLATDPRMRDRLGLEVQRTLDNFERQSGRSGATELLIAPGNLAASVTEHLGVSLGLPVGALTIGRILQMVDVATDVGVAVSDWGYLELLALGAACRGEDK